MSATNQQFVPDPDWPSITELAQELWGAANKKLSSRDDIRFGSKGGRSVKPSANTWFDHEACKGGGYLDLHQAARGELPEHKLPPGKATLPPWQDIDVTYDYLTADGSLLLQVVRTISGNPRFRQRKPTSGNNGTQRWEWHVTDVPGHDRLLYRLPGLRASGAETVWITEGEKDADRLHHAGLIATTNIGGAGKWRDEYAEEFRGRHCVVLADNDPQAIDKKTGKPRFHPDGRPVLTGQDHAADVARALVGVAASVKVPLLPVPQDGSDVSDFLDAGHTLRAMDCRTVGDIRALGEMGVVRVINIGRITRAEIGDAIGGWERARATTPKGV